MGQAEGARTFGVAGETYDAFMGRYSMPLAARFADAAGVVPGLTALDVGCGPGALTAVLVERLGVDAVRACDPSPSFVQACSTRHPGVDVRSGRAEELPFGDEVADVVLAQLVMHFVTDAPLAAREMTRVVRRNGTVAACVWDFADGMEMLRAYWDAALTVDRGAPDEARTMRFGRAGELAALFQDTGLEQIEESTLHVTSSYDDFAQLWRGFLAGVGPAGAHLASLSDGLRDELREELWRRVGGPEGSFTLGAVARCAVARRPA